MKESISPEQMHALETIREIIETHCALWDEKPNPVQAHFLVKEVLAWTSRAVGLEIVRIAYGEIPAADDRAAHLEVLSRRLDMAQAFFKTADPMASEGSLIAASRELAAIAAGDIPILFDRVGRGPQSSEDIVAYRLAEYQARALYWAEVFKLHGVKPGEYQTWISSAYMNLTWDTIRKWKGRVQERVGGKYRSLMSVAKIDADLDRKMPRDFDIEEARGSLIQDGKHYAALLRIAKQGGTGSPHSLTGQDA